MQYCISCGSESNNAPFCGNCGHVQNTKTAIDGATHLKNFLPVREQSLDVFTSRSTQPLPVMTKQEAQSSLPTRHPLPQDQRTQLIQRPNSEGEEQRQRGAVPPFLPFPGALTGQPNVPLVQGMPQTSGTPYVQGTPQIRSFPAANSAGASVPPSVASQAPSLQPPIQFIRPSVQVPPGSSPPPPIHNSASGQLPTHQLHTSHTRKHPKQSNATHPHIPTPKGVLGALPKGLLIIITSSVILGTVAVGVAAYLLTRPQPVISLSSTYQVGGTPAGSTGTFLHLNARTFSSSSAITFLLDGLPAPGNQGAQSDTKGTVEADLTVTDGWAVGRHILTAKDGNGYNTKNSVTVMIVPQGQAHTPGPNGAPPDDTSFKLNVTIQEQDVGTGQQSTFKYILVITGHPDPAGGTVCQSVDNGKPQSYTRPTTINGTPNLAHYRIVAKCSGAYKGGKLSYMETFISDTATFFDNGLSVTCVAKKPYVNGQLDGTFSSHSTISGTYSDDPAITPYNCNHGYNLHRNPGKGTWTGQVVAS